MGIPGILKEIGRGERIALSKLAVEHLERTRRPLRIAIDAAIWNFQNQAGQGGANPALRTLFYRLLKLLALPIHPVFVYDGKNKPLTKRGKTVSAYGTCIPNEMSKKLVQLFNYPHHTAPGEAEAECAFLQKHGIVDAVMSQDVDAIMFGSGMTLRNWSKESTRGNKTATHVDVLRPLEVKDKSGLTPGGLILVALLSGGDYHPDGVPGFGSTLACEIAKAGFGEEFLELISKEDAAGLQEWRERLQAELETNESGYFKMKRKTLRVPSDFPDRTILSYYTDPAVSLTSELPLLQRKWEDSWDQGIDIPVLRKYVADRFEWRYDTGAKKFTRCLAPSLLAHRLRRGHGTTIITSLDAITERRTHFVNDGMPELRVKVIPGEIVGLDMDAEEKNPGRGVDEGLNEDDEAPIDMDELADVEDASATPTTSQRTSKSPSWDPSAPEKMWIPETIVQLGVPILAEAWQQKQRDVLADPIKFANRKVKSKALAKIRDTGMRAGALDGYFGPSKPTAASTSDLSTKSAARAPLKNVKNVPSTKVQMTPPKRSRSAGKYNPCSSLPSPATTPQRGRVISKFLQELQSVGKESQGSIAIDTSPIVPPVLGKQLTQQTLHSPGIVDERNSPAPKAIPETVTRRRRAPGRARSPTASPGHKAPARSLAKSPAKHTAPIESFFGVAKRRAAITTQIAPKSLPMNAVELELPPDLSLGLKVDRMSTKKIAIPRDSLPGTWKEIDPAIINESSSPRLRGRPRISSINLT